MLLRSCAKSKDKPTSVEQQMPIKSRHRPQGLSQTTRGVTITHLYMKCRSHPVLVHIRIHRIVFFFFGWPTLCGNSRLDRLDGNLSWTTYPLWDGNVDYCASPDVST